MKSLNGKELAGFIQERQAKQIRTLKQAHGITPKLVIFKTTTDPVIETYVRVKIRYGEELGAVVELRHCEQDERINAIQEANADAEVHGMIVQLPLAQPEGTEEALNAVLSEKDVDGLGENSTYTPTTPQAIEWLLDGYNVDLTKTISIIGQGRLVGAPLAKLLEQRGINVQTFDDSVEDLRSELLRSDIIISATGVPGLVDESMLKHGAVVVDAGVATADGKTVGDVADSVYNREDLTVTPKKGGVGPLTVSALFENLIRACFAKIG